MEDELSELKSQLRCAQEQKYEAVRNLEGEWTAKMEAARVKWDTDLKEMTRKAEEARQALEETNNKLTTGN